MHAKFDEIWESTGITVDVIAELIRQLDGTVLGSSLEVTANTELPSLHSTIRSSVDYVGIILQDSEILLSSLRDSYLAALEDKEYVINNSLINEATVLNKWVWQLKSLLGKI